jgi:hypothetical protein
MNKNIREELREKLRCEQHLLDSANSLGVELPRDAPLLDALASLLRKAKILLRTGGTGVESMRECCLQAAFTPGAGGLGPMLDTPTARLALLVHNLGSDDIKDALNMTYSSGCLSLHAAIMESVPSALRDGVLDVYRKGPADVVDNSTFDPRGRLPKPADGHYCPRGLGADECWSGGMCGKTAWDRRKHRTWHLFGIIAGDLVYIGPAAFGPAVFDASGGEDTCDVIDASGGEGTCDVIDAADNQLLYAEHGGRWPPLLTRDHLTRMHAPLGLRIKGGR